MRRFLFLERLSATALPQTRNKNHRKELSRLAL
jgi:hypothetical protein